MKIHKPSVTLSEIALISSGRSSLALDLRRDHRERQEARVLHAPPPPHPRVPPGEEDALLAPAGETRPGKDLLQGEPESRNHCSGWISDVFRFAGDIFNST